MNEREAWAAELSALADKLLSVSADELARDEALHDELCEAIQRFEAPEEVYKQIEDQRQYPPEWDDLRSAVETVSAQVLLANMWGWVAVGRWMDAPLARIHEAGWLEPAFRKLAANVNEMELKPGFLG